KIYRDIDNRKPERAAFQKIPDTGFNRGNVLLGNNAAGDRISELETRAAGQRFDVEHHVSKLSVTSGLFLVAAALGCTFADPSPLAPPNRVAISRKLILSLQSLTCDPHVHLAVTGDDRLAAILVLVHSEGRVLLQQPLKCSVEPHIILTLSWAQDGCIDMSGKLYLD